MRMPLRGADRGHAEVVSLPPMFSSPSRKDLSFEARSLHPCLAMAKEEDEHVFVNVQVEEPGVATVRDLSGEAFEADHELLNSAHGRSVSRA